LAHNLILVRHSQSRQNPALPASQWGLSDEGRRRCGALAERLAIYRPVAIVTSRERKAVETGAIVAARLDLPAETAAGLHEHARERAGYSSPEAFEQSVAALFERPGELVFGEETASQAEQRFDQAVSDVLGRYPEQAVAVVAHGTVISLFVARHAGIAPAPFWKSLGMPAIVVLALPDLKLQEVIPSIA
jgi:broad specificity phosphatase PhoE